MKPPRLKPSLWIYDDPGAATPLLSEYGNAYKLTAGKLIGLKDERLMARKRG